MDGSWVIEDFCFNDLRIGSGKRKLLELKEKKKKKII
jgi:hypothetical protein